MKLINVKALEASIRSMYDSISETSFETIQGLMHDYVEMLLLFKEEAPIAHLVREAFDFKARKILTWTELPEEIPQKTVIPKKFKGCYLLRAYIQEDDSFGRGALVLSLDNFSRNGNLFETVINSNGDLNDLTYTIGFIPPSNRGLLPPILFEEPQGISIGDAIVDPKYVSMVGGKMTVYFPRCRCFQRAQLDFGYNRVKTVTMNVNFKRSKTKYLSQLVDGQRFSSL